MRDEDIANSRDIDDQRIDLSLERHNNRIVASVELMYIYDRKQFVQLLWSVRRTSSAWSPKDNNPKAPNPPPPPLSHQEMALTVLLLQ